MNFKLPQTFVSPKLENILKRELKKQRIFVEKLSPKALKELAWIATAIETKGLPNFLVCKPISKTLGKGIFLHPKSRPIPKGSLIGCYAGDPIVMKNLSPEDGSYAFVPLHNMFLSREEQTSFDPHSSYHPRRLYSFKIDAFKQGNFTRYVNHSEEPNLIATMSSIPKNPYGLAESPLEVVYFTRKTIYPGEQLLISYEADGQKSYWNDPNRQPYPMNPRTFMLDKNSLNIVQDLG